MKTKKIDRRRFLNNSLVIGASSLLGAKLAGQIPANLAFNSEEVFKEPEKDLPVYGRFDVIVVGGGPAGFAAALASARNGARTLIIERYPFFGGTATASLMLNINGFRNQVKPDGLQTSKGIPEEVILNLKEIKGIGISSYKQEQYPDEKGQMSYSYAIDGEKTKYVLTKMLYDEGVNILFHTMFVDSIMEGNNIAGIIIENISGRQAIFGKVIIDASGDASVSYKAGVPYWQADLNKDKHLPNCLMYKVNVKPEYSEKLGGPLTNNSLILWGPTSDTDGVNADDVTRGEIDTRLKVFEHFRNTQKNRAPLLDDAYIVETAPQMGIRQTRFIEGLYKSSAEDAIEGRKFDDSIAMSACPIINYYGYRRYLEHEGYEIPYRSLLPQKVEGLIVAGRCISSDQQSYESWRAMAPTMSIGEAAGTSAALCVKTKKLPKEIDVEMIRRQLIKQGAEIGQNKKV
ncbi:MAG TPA: FAD-dependent oxidoreductase [Bacteroidales bacterium]|nr:FAD-dependent oxidoreductase [Bacteroidales bacterium]